MNQGPCNLGKIQMLSGSRKSCAAIFEIGLVVAAKFAHPDETLFPPIALSFEPELDPPAPCSLLHTRSGTSQYLR
jgi:hypothetical protein